MFEVRGPSRQQSRAPVVAVQHRASPVSSLLGATFAEARMGEPQVHPGRRDLVAPVDLDPRCGSWNGGALPWRTSPRVSPPADTPTFGGESNSRSTTAPRTLHPYNPIRHLPAAVDVLPGAHAESSADL